MPERRETPKGILKNRESSSGKKQRTGIQWDEENVQATYHPADKDYGHMKINEPPTPYESGSDYEELIDQTPNESSQLEISQKLEEAERNLTSHINLDIDQTFEDDSVLTEEQIRNHKQFKIEHKKEFENRRKEHYNEYSKIREARALIEKEFADEQTNN